MKTIYTFTSQIIVLLLTNSTNLFKINKDVSCVPITGVMLLPKGTRK